jgi:hypothetical protein
MTKPYIVTPCSDQLHEWQDREREKDLIPNLRDGIKDDLETLRRRGAWSEIYEIVELLDEWMK